MTDTAAPQISGAPYKTPSVRRKLPAPFERSRIDLDGGRRVKRSWSDTPVIDIAEGDIVANFGRVASASHDLNIGNADRATAWQVRLVNVMGEVRDFGGEQRVYAFSKDEA